MDAIYKHQSYFVADLLLFYRHCDQAFKDYLKITDDGIVIPQDSHLIPALGAALSADKNKAIKLSSLIENIQKGLNNTVTICQRVRADI